jgi:hypothetical protein
VLGAVQMPSWSGQGGIRGGGGLFADNAARCTGMTLCSCCLAAVQAPHSKGLLRCHCCIAAGHGSFTATGKAPAAGGVSSG